MSVFGYQALGRGADAQAGVPLPGAGGVSGVSRARGAPPWTERSDARTADCFNLQSAVPPRRAHEYMAVRLCIEVRPLVPKGILQSHYILQIQYITEKVLWPRCKDLMIDKPTYVPLKFSVQNQNVLNIFSATGWGIILFCNYGKCAS